MNEELISLLSVKLQEKLVHEEAFVGAFQKRFLIVRDGVVVSRFGKPWALAYFCGRAFSNDRPKKVQKHRIWQKGDREFPAKELNAFFGKKDLREVRKNHINCKNPDWFEDIDNLFDTCIKR